MEVARWYPSGGPTWPPDDRLAGHWISAIDLWFLRSGACRHMCMPGSTPRQRGVASERWESRWLPLSGLVHESFGDGGACVPVGEDYRKELVMIGKKTRGAAAVIVTASLAAGGASLLQAPPAAAASKKYLEQVCIIPAVVGDGVKGNGCNLYGTAHWVSVSDRPTLAPDIVGFITNCAAGGSAAVVAAQAERKVTGAAAKAKGKSAFVEIAGVAVKGCFEHSIANAITSAAAGNP